MMERAAPPEEGSRARPAREALWAPIGLVVLALSAGIESLCGKRLCTRVLGETWNAQHGRG